MHFPILGNSELGTGQRAGSRRKEPYRQIHVETGSVGVRSLRICLHPLMPYCFRKEERAKSEPWNLRGKVEAYCYFSTKEQWNHLSTLGGK